MAKEFPLVPNRRTSADPFDAVLQPPPGETPADRDRRLLAELEAKRVSDSIDEMLKAEKKERRSRPDVKILLLGQSESGKSTTLKRACVPPIWLFHPLSLSVSSLLPPLLFIVSLLSPTGAYLFHSLR